MACGEGGSDGLDLDGLGGVWLGCGWGGEEREKMRDEIKEKHV